MIARPSSAEVIRGIRAALKEDVSPHVPEGPATVTLGLVDTLLANLAVRVENEISWMVQESTDIDAGVSAVLPQLPGPEAGRVTSALEALRADTAADLSLAAVQDRYSRASAVLGDVLEIAVTAELPAVRDQMLALLSARRGHETEVIGELVMVGRS